MSHDYLEQCCSISRGAYDALHCNSSNRREVFPNPHAIECVSYDDLTVRRRLIEFVICYYQHIHVFKCLCLTKKVLFELEGLNVQEVG